MFIINFETVLQFQASNSKFFSMGWVMKIFLPLHLPDRINVTSLCERLKHLLIASRSRYNGGYAKCVIGVVKHPSRFTQEHIIRR